MMSSFLDGSLVEHANVKSVWPEVWYLVCIVSKLTFMSHHRIYYYIYMIIMSYQLAPEIGTEEKRRTDLIVRYQSWEQARNTRGRKKGLE